MGKDMKDMTMWEDMKDWPLGLIAFESIPNCTIQRMKCMFSYKPFMSEFMISKLQTIWEPHVWRWIIFLEKFPTFTKLYKNYISLSSIYTTIHTCLAKLKGFVKSTKPKATSKWESWALHFSRTIHLWMDEHP